jgi:hypothetical protein
MAGKLAHEDRAACGETRPGCRWACIHFPAWKRRAAFAEELEAARKQQLIAEESMAAAQLRAKEVEFYAAGVAAWYATRFEVDKSLMALSAGGVGLLVTLMTTKGVPNSSSFVLYTLALLSFSVSILALLSVFHLNSGHLEEVLNGVNGDDPKLVGLDRAAKWSFFLGALLSACIGISTAGRLLIEEKEKTMADNKSGTPTQLRESVSGAAQMRPTSNTGVMQKSVTGAAAIRPQASAPVQQSTPPAQSSGKK